MNRLLTSGLKVIAFVNIGILICLLAVTVIDVIGRYIFNASFIDAMMISSFLLAAVNALALSQITYAGEHVQVDLLYQRFPRRLKTVFGSINALLAAVLFYLMSWFAFDKAVVSYRRGIYKGWMHLPEYPARFLFAFGCLLTALVFTLVFLNIFLNREDRERWL